MSFGPQVGQGKNARFVPLNIKKILIVIPGQSDSFGSIETGKLADIIAVPGNPIDDITLMQKVVFVMKEGKVYKSED